MPAAAGEYGGGGGLDTVHSNINLERIHSFLEEPVRKLESVKRDVARWADNSDSGGERTGASVPTSHPEISLQQRMESATEMRRECGPSSCFGDGDGTFWDRWLTTTGHFDKTVGYKVVSMPERSMHSWGKLPPRSGFKRFQQEHVLKSNDNLGTVMRRQKYAQCWPLVAPDLPPLEQESGDSQQISHSGMGTPRCMEEQQTLKEKHNVDISRLASHYFDPAGARKNFFSDYKQLSRRRHITMNAAMKLGSSSPVWGGPEQGQDKIGQGYPAGTTSESPTKPHRGHILPELPLADMAPVAETETVSEATSRTKFLFGCVDKHLAPRAALIVRKLYTTIVDLSHLGMGDELGLVLAPCLSDLPLMQELNLCDNRLTDVSLLPIMLSLSKREDLQSLDLSQNKIDSESAAAIAAFLGQRKNLSLTTFTLSAADINDVEAAMFVRSLCKQCRAPVTRLDLKHNLLGSQESINYVNPEFHTGPEAISDWLKQASCQLQYLDLSWNTIRMSSAVDLCDSLRVNCSLVRLELGYNGLGPVGGEALGAALHRNETLQILNIEANSISPRACFVICEALIINKSLREVRMGNNPLGKTGAKCVMRMPSERGGDLKIDAKGSNFQVDDKNSWFDEEKIGAHYEFSLHIPYDRAVALYILRRAGRDEGLRLFRAVLKDADVRESHELNLIVSSNSSQAESDILKLDPAQVFAKYDADGSGSLDRKELIKALSDLRMGGAKEVSDLLDMYDEDGSGTIEMAEFIAYTQQKLSRIQKVQRAARQFIAEEKDPRRPYQPQDSGTLCLDIEFLSLPGQGTHTTAEHTEGMLGLLGSLGDGMANLMQQALANVTLDLEQGLRMYSKVLHDSGENKAKALVQVLPRMASASEARLLMNAKLTSWEEKRLLRHELGPAFGIIMGLPAGHYCLDLSKQAHRLALRLLVEHMNKERVTVDRTGKFDTSQQGNGESVRNETMNGRCMKFRSSRFETPPAAGILEFDHVSMMRPAPTSASMSLKRFASMLLSIGLISPQEAVVMQSTGGPQRLTNILNKMQKYPFDREFAKNLEELQMAWSGRQGATTSRRRTSGAILGHLKRSSGRSNGEALIRSSASTSRSSFAVVSANVSIAAAAFKLQIQRRERSAHHMLDEDQDDGEGGLNRRMSGLMLAMLKLEDFMVERFISTAQLSYILICLGEQFSMDKNLENSTVDLITKILPRIVDLENMASQVVACLPPHIQAALYHRIGWLNLWTPLNPDGYYMLDMACREDRQMAKMLVHLRQAEGSDCWKDETYTYERGKAPIGGWRLSNHWLTEDGLPTRGILSFAYCSPPTPNWELRFSLCACVLSDAPSELAREHRVVIVPQKASTLATTTHGVDFFYHSQSQSRSNSSNTMLSQN
jgi:hypothetical protein